MEAIGEKLEDKEKIMTKDRFRFGNTPYNSLGRIKLPVYLKDKEGKIKEKEVTFYMIEKNVELLVGNSTRDLWKVVTADYENTYYLDKELNRPFRGRRTQGGHIAVALWTKESEEEKMEEVEYNYIEVENKDEVFCCDKCGYSTQYERKLWKHEETDHSGKIEKVEYIKEEKIEEWEKDKEEDKKTELKLKKKR